MQKLHCKFQKIHPFNKNKKPEFRITIHNLTRFFKNPEIKVHIYLQDLTKIRCSWQFKRKRERKYVVS